MSEKPTSPYSLPDRLLILALWSSTPAASTSSATPTSSSAIIALACTTMPAPTAETCSARSSTRTSQPALRSATAAVSPPIPPPTIKTSALMDERPS